MNRPVVGVLALQGDVVEHEAALRACGVDVRRVRRARDLVGLAGIVLPGGESTTISKLLVAFDLLGPLRDAGRQGLPVLGTCAGMVLLAERLVDGVRGQQTLGLLDVVVRRNAFGRQVDSFDTSVTVRPSWSQPYETAASFIRAPVVEEAGPGVEVLARTADGRIVAVRQGRVLATSFHPEITGDLATHRMFVELALGDQDAAGPT